MTPDGGKLKKKKKKETLSNLRSPPTLRVSVFNPVTLRPQQNLQLVLLKFPEKGWMVENVKREREKGGVLSECGVWGVGVTTGVLYDMRALVKYWLYYSW